MITLEADFVGRVDRGPRETIEQERKAEREANLPHKDAKRKKNRKRKRQKSQKNVIDEKKVCNTRFDRVRVNTRFYNT